MIACVLIGFFCMLRVVHSEEASAVDSEINVFTQDLIAPSGGNWLAYNGDYSGRRYSSLSQIDVNNVHTLRAEWVFHSSTSDHLEVTPVVVNGTMFVTSANDVVALDASSGRTLWRYTR